MKKFVISLWIVLGAASCLAQSNLKKPPREDKPDLSGVWVLDISRGNFDKFNHELAKGGITLIVSEHEPEIKITRKFRVEGKERTQELIYYTDGRGETNPAMTIDYLIKSKTNWDGRKLVSRSTNSTMTRGHRIHVDTVERWELSTDGQTLIHTTSLSPLVDVSGPGIFVPANTEDIKKVFKRGS